jgi:hypothetical protein
MKITSLKEVFADHRDELQQIVKSLVGPTLASRLNELLRLRKVSTIKNTIAEGIKK